MTEDIQIEIHIQGPRPIDTKSLLEVFNAVEMALYDSDRQDIDLAARALQLPPLLRDAALERLRHFRNKRFLLTGAHAGSIELIGLVAGVSYWVLEKTLAEGFQES